jgi:hypothetical protein
MRRHNKQVLLMAHDAEAAGLLAFTSRILVFAPQQNCEH